MGAYVRLWYCLTLWGIVNKIFYLCICVLMLCIYICVHVCVYRCMCICLYMYICMSVYMYAYTLIYTSVWVWAHFVYLYCPISLLHARVSQVFLNTCMRVCGRIGSGVCFSLFMVSACCWRGRLCFGRGRDRGFVLYISVFLRVLGWLLCVCLYTRVHKYKLLGYLMWAQVWDGHLQSQKNPDRLKHSIHVDHIGVHSTFVNIYAGLRVLMIWANCFFLLTYLFFWEK